MKIFAIADLHLSGFAPKPMNIFGEQWNDHWAKIADNWNELVSPDDVVLLPGDLSWAMRLNEAKVDLDTVCKMPGKKIIIKGREILCLIPTRVFLWREIQKKDLPILLQIKIKNRMKISKTPLL